MRLVRQQKHAAEICFYARLAAIMLSTVREKGVTRSDALDTRRAKAGQAWTRK
jgi:hypothetical protein